MISYEVIGHEMELGKSRPEKHVQTERKIFLSRLNIKYVLSVIKSDRLDVSRTN